MPTLAQLMANRALAAGAGDGPGQMHVDDWLAAHPDPNDRGAASTLLNQLTGAQSTMADYNTAQQQLAQALKYDPNATLEKIGDSAQDYGQDPNGGGQIALNNYILHMDNSKLPAFQGAGIDPSKYGGWVQTDPTGKNVNAIANNDQYVIHDPNYGDITYRGNLKQAGNDKQDALWKGINMAAHLVPAALGGAGALGLIGGGSGLAGSIYGGLSSAMNSMANGGGVGELASLLPSLIGQIPGLQGISPYLSAANGIYHAAHGNIGSGLGAGMTLGQLMNNGGGNG